MNTIRQQQQKTPLLDAISPHLMKLFCFLEKRGKIWGTCRRDLHVRQPESRGWNPGSRAEGYYDHVAILHFVVWRRCEWTAQNQTNQLLLTGHTATRHTNSGVKDTPVTINGHDGNIAGVIIFLCPDPIFCGLNLQLGYTVYTSYVVLINTRLKITSTWV